MECGELIKQYLLSLLTVFRKKIRGKKYTLPQILILSTIPDKGMDMTSLSEKIGVDNSTATRLIDGMVRLNLVIKRKSHLDKRITIVLLTEKGEQTSEEIENKLDIIGEEIFNQIPMEHQDDIKEALLSFHWTLLKYNNSV
ncbi:MAG: MarR family transcriptional regulator [Candidatus Neomarinimicrobiota bacterium]|jgi:DNA-binding MarR family transcriptional regulator|nr:MarR family transcriptional regulator [Candidatus Neomarinimicrobiota bacterium]|tara:strand:+ start:9886 stop:10308 length:423 start_codon:yes stop_codon:yes gene_type:complete